MRKREELSDPKSCLNKAADDELLFVLRAKDPVCVSTVLAWINFRIAAGFNTKDDPKIREAYRWCQEVADSRPDSAAGKMLPKE